MIGAGATATRALTLRVSVIIPVLDEEALIAGQLVALSRVPGVREVIVVDGGSSDRTLEHARWFSGVRVVEGGKGRASQMNAGARIATGDVLLFLHADVRLPADAVTWIHRTLADPEIVGGAFRTWTVAEGRRTWLAPLLRLADLRSRYTRLPYGDQAIFVRAEVFQRAGGFPEQPLMEDLEFSRRLKQLGRICTVPATVRVSGRRFLARPLYYAVLVNLFPLLYVVGISPQRLAALYGNPR